MLHIGEMSAEPYSTGSSRGGKLGNRGHVRFQRVSRGSPIYRPGPRANCDVEIYVDHGARLERHPCYVTHSTSVITRNAVERDLITKMVVAYKSRGMYRSLTLYGRAYCEKDVVGVRSPDHGIIFLDHDKWLREGWIPEAPEPQCFACLCCLLH